MHSFWVFCAGKSDESVPAVADDGGDGGSGEGVVGLGSISNWRPDCPNPVGATCGRDRLQSRLLHHPSRFLLKLGNDLLWVSAGWWVRGVAMTYFGCEAVLRIAARRRWRPLAVPAVQARSHGPVI